MARPQPVREQADFLFAQQTAAKVRSNGFKIMGEMKSPEFVVFIRAYLYIGMVCSQDINQRTVKRLASKVRTWATLTPKIGRIVIVTAQALDRVYLDALRTSHNVDVITIEEIGRYLSRLKKTSAMKRGEISERAPAPGPKSKPRTTARQIQANIDAIIVITRSLAAQIDDKLQSIEQRRGNSYESIAAIAEYQELRDKVAELERMVARLRRSKVAKSETEKVVEAGSAFGRTVTKFLDTHGPEVLLNGANMGIVCASAGVLALLGVNPIIGAGIAGWIITGKSPTELFKSASAVS